MRILSLCTRNEVRMANGVFASWGNGKRNDWALAAEKLGNLILGKNTQQHFSNTFYHCDNATTTYKQDEKT